MLVYSIVFITSALIFYTISVWSEKKQGELKMMKKIPQIHFWIMWYDNKLFIFTNPNKRIFCTIKILLISLICNQLTLLYLLNIIYGKTIIVIYMRKYFLGDEIYVTEKQ